MPRYVMPPLLGRRLEHSGSTIMLILRSSSTLSRLGLPRPLVLLALSSMTLSLKRLQTSMSSRRRLLTSSSRHTLAAQSVRAPIKLATLTLFCRPSRSDVPRLVDPLDSLVLSVAKSSYSPPRTLTGLSRPTGHSSTRPFLANRASLSIWQT